jgi:hypothetical protein
VRCFFFREELPAFGQMKGVQPRQEPIRSIRQGKGGNSNGSRSADWPSCVFSISFRLLAC